MPPDDSPLPVRSASARVAPLALTLVVFTAAALVIHRAAEVGFTRAFVVMLLGWGAVVLTMCFCQLMREALEEDGGREPDGVLGAERTVFRSVLDQVPSGRSSDLFNGRKQLGFGALIGLTIFALDQLFPLQLHAFALNALLLVVGWMAGTGCLLLQHQLARWMQPVRQ